MTLEYEKGTIAKGLERLKGDLAAALKGESLSAPARINLATGLEILSKALISLEAEVDALRKEVDQLKSERT